MKKIFLIISSMLMTVTSISMAVTLSGQSGQDSTTPFNESTTHFALSGTITDYQASNAIIFIDGKEYILDGQGELTNADIKPGTHINYNLEKSSQEKTGHITKIWLNIEDK